MKKIVNRVVILAGVALLAACGGNVKESLGLKKDAPDEFKVISKPPLSVPPNFNLRPPREGGEAEPSKVPEETREILFAPSSGGNDEQGNLRSDDVFLNKIGANKADSNIRQVLHEENSAVTSEDEEKGLFKKILSKKEVQEDDPIVNAGKESERIKENIQNGDSVTKGETPTISQKKGILQKIFGSDDE